MKYHSFLVPILIALMMSNCQTTNSNKNNQNAVESVPVLTAQLLSDSVPTNQNLNGALAYENVKTFVKDEMVSYYRVNSEQVLDENNVRQYTFEFLDPGSGRVVKSIDVQKNNPFLNAGAKIIPGISSQAFFFLDIPQNKIESYINNNFGPEVKKLITDSGYNYMIQCGQVWDASAKKFIAISYFLDMERPWYEKEGAGLSVTNVHVYDSSGNLIHKELVDGYIFREAIVSEDGKYLVTLSGIDPHWEEQKRARLSITRIEDHHVVYTDHFYDVDCRSGPYLVIEQNWINVGVLEKVGGSIFCLNADNGILYKSKEKIQGLYSMGPHLGNGVEITFINRPDSVLVFEKDFNLIIL